MELSVLFVVHAGEGIGLGHLTRSLVAARSLVSQLDARVDFAAVGRNIDKRLARKFKVNFSVYHESVDIVIDRLTKNDHHAALCLDLFHPLLSDRLRPTLENIRQAGCQIIVIDSLAGCESLIDLLYVPSFVPPALLEVGVFQGRLAYGWDAYLLNVQPRSPMSRKEGSILVLTGGSDVTRLGKNLPKIFDETLPQGSVVNWVTGPFSERPIIPNPSRIDFVEHLAPAGLSALMHSAEVAATVFGVSFFELIALGVPTVVFSPYGEKDSRELAEIAKSGIALVADDANDAAKKTAMLLGDCDLRNQLSNSARDKIKSFDGQLFANEVSAVLNA